MKKENNQEFYVEQMDVHYPRRSEIQNEIEDIILKGMPQKISFLKRMKKIYLGPGLRVIYYKNLSVFFATFIIYIAVCLGLVLSFEEEIRQFGAAFLGMPVFFLLFSYFTCYMDEQTQINELRNTMYYSMNYIVSLRLFYTAVVLSLVNTSFLFLSGIREKAILSVGVVGVSSMLVFAIIAVYIYHRWNNYKCFAGLGAIWVLLFAAIMRLQETKILFLFEYIPLGIQIATMIVCFMALFILVGRMLTLSHIRKDYGKFTAVEDINLELENGLYAMLAPNGAGKTTLIKMITTLLYPTSGEILYNGMDIYKMGETYRDVIGYLPQHFGYYKNNTPTQYLDYLAALKGISKEAAREKIPELLELVGLSDVSNKKMKKFSGGMIQRVGIAQAMLNDPKILVLDEPTAGLDPKERVRFRNILSVLSKDRIVILSTHIVSDIESIANHVIMIKEKQLLKNDTVPNICKELEGKVFEKSINESKIQEFEQKRIILSMRQESEKMMVRYYSEEEDNNARPCTPNLEDVFLVTYREEK